MPKAITSSTPPSWTVTGRRAGAVIGVRRVRNPGPRRPCRSGRPASWPSSLAGPAADRLRRRDGGSPWSIPPISPPSAGARTSPRLKARGEGRHGGGGLGSREARHRRRRGARPRQGHLAAATSTGGYTNKPAGRVGDSPIVGRRHLCRRTASARSRARGKARPSSATRWPTTSRPACAYRGDALDAATAGVHRRPHAVGHRCGADRARRRRAGSPRPSTPAACTAAG